MLTGKVDNDQRIDAGDWVIGWRPNDHGSAPGRSDEGGVSAATAAPLCGLAGYRRITGRFTELPAPPRPSPEKLNRKV